MSRDLREYFKRHSVAGEKRAGYTGTQLTRGGISDMDALYRLLEQEPEKLLGLRNIGPKSMEVIHEGKIIAFEVLSDYHLPENRKL